MIQDIQLKINSGAKLSFTGGEMSSDSGCLIVKEFADSIGLKGIIEKRFIVDGDDARREHSNSDLLMQQIMLAAAGYHNQMDSTLLRNDPVFNEILGARFASQSTVSRFYNRLTENTEDVLMDINAELAGSLLKRSRPKELVLDLDSTHCQTYGEQECSSYNAHYRAEGFHPLMVFEAGSGLLLKSEQRPGNFYSSLDVAEFIMPVLERYEKFFPKIRRMVRGDSGFATPELYEACEATGTDYVIRLKSNPKLAELSRHLYKSVMDETRVWETLTATGEFMYQAGSWSRGRRVVAQVKRMAGEVDPQYMFIVTTLNLGMDEVIEIYRQRGTMENYIKECKNGFLMGRASHSAFVANTNHMQVCSLAYNLVQGFKLLVLPPEFKKMQVGTLRSRLFKVAARKARSGRQTFFRVCSHFVHQDIWIQALTNIHSLIP
jgi:hypothetical protein